MKTFNFKDPETAVWYNIACVEAFVVGFLGARLHFYKKECKLREEQLETSFKQFDDLNAAHKEIELDLIKKPKGREA